MPIDTAVPERCGRGTPRQVQSDVHKGRPCTSCVLCKEKAVQYTHPVRWKDATLYEFLVASETNLNIPPDACICRNCRDSLSTERKTPDSYKPRWARVAASTSTTQCCEVPGCAEASCRRTTLANREEISHHLKCSPLSNSGSPETSLCDGHYRTLDKLVNPANYQWKCAVCSTAIRGSNYHNFRTCTDPDLFQRHLKEHTDYEGTITASDKVCMECYRHSLLVVRLAKEKPVTTDEGLRSLIDSIKDSMTPLLVHEDNEIIDHALKMTAVCIARQLLKNQALTLQRACEIFRGSIEFQFPTSTPVRTPRWLLGQLSVLLKHHLAYTCRVKKHGTILYRQGRELDCLSHALFTLKTSQSTPDHVKVCKSLNERLRIMAGKSKSLTGLLDIEQQIRSVDPMLWDMVCTLTQSTRDKLKHTQTYGGRKKNLRRLYILHLLLYCMDNTCSMPFHVVIADLIDCHSGNSELIRTFNRLGVCVSQDTLLRRIRGTVQHITRHGLLHGMNYSCLTVFTMDNIDFLHSYAQVFSGNQQLSWHGTTIQAVQCKPSACTSMTQNVGLRRAHALLSPMNSPTQSPVPQKSRARTGTELSQLSQTTSSTASTGTVGDNTSYCFSVVETYSPNSISLSIENFRLTTVESSRVKEFISHATSYCLLRNSLPDDKQLVSLQNFFSIATKASSPEVGIVKYVQVLDEIADSKDTILHIVSELYAHYICKHGNKYLVLEGDAKTYDTMQDVKREYAKDQAWLVPYPWDWHLLKNFQICLMKPFYEAGLKELAEASSYPSQSIQNCTKFKRTHRFLMEVWEALYRSMLLNFLAQSPHKLVWEGTIAATLSELEKTSYDELAVYSVIRSFREARGKLDECFSSYVDDMAGKDDTWKFWSRFVFEDCKPYISLFMAIRSEDWYLRMGAIKSMAADFTAFDHPCYQQLIRQHIVDVLNMPEALLGYFRSGGFVLSITGNTLHSVALDECHEMLINKHVKQSIVRPTKDYISRITQYIPYRVKSAENFKSQIFPIKKPPTGKSGPILLAADKRAIKSAANVQCMLHKIHSSKLLPLTCPLYRGLINPFRGLIANAAQSHDLLNFNKLEQDMYELRIKAYVLKAPSVKVPQRRKRLQTFATRKKGNKRHVNAAQQELKRVQKCIRKKIAYANKTCTKPDVVGQQYIEFPRALHVHY